MRRGDWVAARRSFEAAAAGVAAPHARLAILQLARVEYGRGALREAIAAYERLPPGSVEWRRSLFESAWAHLLSGERRPKALGNIESLRTDYFPSGLYPETDVLEALVFHSRCQYDRAIASARAARKSLARARRTLSPLLEVDDELVRLRRGRIAMSGSGPIARVLDGDRSVARALAWVDEVEREVAVAARLDATWRTAGVGIDTEQRLAIALAFAQTEAGRQIGARLEDAAAELARLSSDAARIELEALEAKTELTRRRVLGRSGPARPVRERVPSDDQHYRWEPIDGDVWPDEVGSLYVPITDHCDREPLRNTNPVPR